MKVFNIATDCNIKQVYFFGFPHKICPHRAENLSVFIFTWKIDRKMSSHVHHISSLVLSPLLLHPVHGCKAMKQENLGSILHDSHDLIEENPIGQPLVAVPGTLGNWVYFHVLAVECNAVLPLHHLLKQLNLRETGRIYVVYVCRKADRRRERDKED